MAFLLQLIILGIIVLIGFQVWNAMKGSRAVEHRDAKTIDGTAEEVSSPGKHAAETLKEFEDVRAELKSSYPAVFAMLGGYLNSYTINETGSLEAAVKEMIADWKARADEVSRELTKLLAENETEEEARAVVVAACDATFEEEGYRAWLTWLLGQFNEFN
jgi:predicted negative regulator of RcsB-dependent stress response